MKGGKSMSEQQIIDILGDKFKSYVQLYQSHGIEPFTGKYYKGLSGGNGIPDDAIHYELTQYLLALGCSFHNVERPSEVRAKYYEDVGQRLYQVIAKLNATEAGDPFEMDQFLFDVNEPAHLYPGLNLGGSDWVKKITGKFNRNHSAIFNIYIYLLGFISLLKLEKLNGGKVVKFLVANDEKNFNILVRDLVDNLQDDSIHNIDEILNLDRQVIISAVIGGIEIMANVIIENIREADKNITTVNISNITNNIGKYDGTKNSFKIIAQTYMAPGGNVTDLTDELDKINADFFKSDAALAVTPEIAKSKKAGVFNPYLLDLNEYLKVYDSAKKILGATVTIPAPAGEAVEDLSGGYSRGGVAQYNSAEYLYRDNTIITEATSTGNDKYLKNGSIQILRNIIDEIKQNYRLDFLPIVLGLLNYIFDKNIPYGDYPMGIDEIRKSMMNAATNYVRASQRLKMTADRLGEFVGRYVDAFVGGFSKYAQKYITAKTTGGQPKGKIRLDQLRNFYEIIKKDPNFYGHFFNLIFIQDNGTEVPISNIAGANMSELQRYRLNVKKFGEVFGPIQYGGAMIGEPIFYQVIPIYDPSMGLIYITRDTYLDPSKQAISNSIFVDAVAQVFISPASTINIGGITVDLASAVNNSASIKRFSYDSREFIKKLLEKSDVGFGVRTTDAWEEAEDRIREHQLMNMSEWAREGHNFVKYDKNDNVIPTNIEDSCQFAFDDVLKCQQFLETCALADEDNRNGFPSGCKQIIGVHFNFDNSPAKGKLMEMIQKINPRIAFGILRSFNFGQSEVMETEPLYGFMRYKVQSVGYWLRDIKTKPEVRKYFGADENEIKQTIDMIVSKKGLLEYLDILVDWVNANPQALNQEESKRLRTMAGPYRSPDKSFDMYNYVQPYYQRIEVKNKLYDICYGLKSLLTGIGDGHFGFNYDNILNSMKGVQDGTTMPFSRMAFTYPRMMDNFRMRGGWDFGTAGRDYKEFMGFRIPQGHKVIQDLFQQLLNAIRCTKNIGSQYRINLCKDTENKLNARISNLSIAEREIYNSIKNMIIKYKLFTNSGGLIDPANVPDNELQRVVKKHSNLFGLTRSYNEKAQEIIEYLISIATTVIDKINTKMTKDKTVDRKLSMGWTHYPVA